MTRPLRLGVVGFGRRMRSVLGAIQRAAPDARVAAVLDPRADELRAAFPVALADAAVCPDVPSLLRAGIDGVLVGTRCSLHAPYAVEALASGLPLFLEKPVATSWEQLESLRAAAATTRSPAVVSFPLRVSAMCRLAREIVDSGVIGRVEQAQAVNNVPLYASGYYHGWMRDEEETGGLWLQKATHDFDYITYLVGRRPEQVVAMESKTVFQGDMPAGQRCDDCPRADTCPESPPNLLGTPELIASLRADQWRCAFAVDTGNHDSASALIRYEGGVHAVYTQNFYTRRGAAKRGITLVGYRGTLTFDWYADELVVHHHHSDRVDRHRFDAGGDGHHGGDDELARDYVALLHGAPSSRAPLEAGILSAAMCLAARDAARTGLPQSVPAAFVPPERELATAFPTS